MDTQPITDIKEIQAILRTGLCYFADACEKHGLRYYLANGTLLGAAKYGGFIPWDDDVDILMPREDYEALQQLEELRQGEFVLRSSATCATWRVPFSKLTHAGTVCHETTADFGCELGVSLDIFPIDGWADRLQTANRRAALAGLWRRCMSASIEERFFSPRTGVRRCILWLIWCFSHLCGHTFFRRRIQRMAARFADRSAAYVGCVAWACYGQAEVAPAQEFSGEKRLAFEGREHPVFAGYEAYLTRLYGDWRADLPPERQKTHHTFAVYRF
ncbi:MAG: LicD family protein [Clostridia bacterium]|nr:LicD family protein [Clostridia bacterium]